MTKKSEADSLEIPEFLKRTVLKTKESVEGLMSAHTTIVKWSSDNKFSPYSKHPPKSARFNGAKRVKLNLADEAPSIGSGFRIVWAKVGKKWVYLCDNRGKRGRLRRDTYNRLKVRDVRDNTDD